jgi:hypothetical protein
LNDGAGGSTPVLKSYTTTYTATWSGYYGDGGTGGTKELIDEAYIGQGHSPTYGATIGLYGFSSQIATDLTGATLKSASLTAYANWWSQTSGGTAVIGHHDYTSQPGYLSGARVDENEMQREDWPKPGAVTIKLNSTFLTGLAAGTIRGIAFGDAPGESTATVYRGHFDGVGQAYPATLTLTYTK